MAGKRLVRHPSAQTIVLGRITLAKSGYDRSEKQRFEPKRTRNMAGIRSKHPTRPVCIIARWRRNRSTSVIFLVYKSKRSTMLAGELS